MEAKDGFIIAPDKLLEKRLAYVTESPDLKLLEKMFDYMDSRKGCGVSANQVGVEQAFFVAKFSFGGEVCINPVVIRHGNQELEEPEGCLSILGKDGNPVFKPKNRWAVIDVEYSNLDDLITTTLKRGDARIFQHEMDHLNGVLCQ